MEEQVLWRHGFAPAHAVNTFSLFKPVASVTFSDKNKVFAPPIVDIDTVLQRIYTALREVAADWNIRWLYGKSPMCCQIFNATHWRIYLYINQYSYSWQPSSTLYQYCCFTRAPPARWFLNKWKYGRYIAATQRQICTISDVNSVRSPQQRRASTASPA